MKDFAIRKAILSNHVSTRVFSFWFLLTNGLRDKPYKNVCVGGYIVLSCSLIFHFLVRLPCMASSFTIVAAMFLRTEIFAFFCRAKVVTRQKTWNGRIENPEGVIPVVCYTERGAFLPL